MAREFGLSRRHTTNRGPALTLNGYLALCALAMGVGAFIWFVLKT